MGLKTLITPLRCSLNIVQLAEGSASGGIHDLRCLPGFRAPPSNRICPSDTVSSPAIILSNVVFPANVKHRVVDLAAILNTVWDACWIQDSEISCAKRLGPSNISNLLSLPLSEGHSEASTGFVTFGIVPSFSITLDNKRFIKAVMRRR